jgi:hypothetical protein
MLRPFAVEMMTYPDADDPRPTWLRLRCNFSTEGEADEWARGRKRFKCRRRAVYRVVHVQARGHAAQVGSPTLRETGGTSAVGCRDGGRPGTGPERSEAQSGERSERASRPRSEAEHGPQGGTPPEEHEAARREVMS